ncbi:hypothetical protein NDU88_004403 [Pleurodeles waltl]|uniref:Uncharacterized protein n=1 Tax=Pleurodeles waltl TaxID=8319 RepID=A0AAV7VK62_PLEWA|nr:hypothetical protein NDU88_004403 [Pleurodeles waltl]
MIRTSEVVYSLSCLKVKEREINMTLGLMSPTDDLTLISDPHAIVPSTVSDGGDPEAAQRAALPIGSTWCPRDERAVKGEVPEHQEEIFWSGSMQEAAAERTQRKEKTKEERS